MAQPERARNVTLQRFSVRLSIIVCLSACFWCHVFSNVPCPLPFPISLQPVRGEWWTWSLLASVSHQLQPHRILHLSTPYEAFAQQTVLFRWARALSSFFSLFLLSLSKRNSDACFHVNLIYLFFLPTPALKRFLLYVRRSEIRGVDIDNPYMNVMTALTVPDIDDVTVVDYDALEERIYWADVKTQTIKRAFINGTQLETIISAGR